MLARVYDPITSSKPKWTQNFRGLISEVESLSYTRRAYDIGSFEMVVPCTEKNKALIATDTIIIFGDVLKTASATGSTQTTLANNAFYVTTVQELDDKTLRVSGYDLKYLLSFRITLFPKREQDKGTYGYFVVKGSTFHCVSELIDYNLSLATEENRRIFGFGRMVMPNIQQSNGLTGIADDRCMTRLEPLSTAIFKLLKNCGTLFYEVRVMIDEVANKPDGYIPRMESGEDKDPIIVTPDLYDISSYSKTKDVSSYKNVIYAVSNIGTGTSAVVQSVSKKSSVDSGIFRKEVAIDVDADTVSELPEYALRSAEEYEAIEDFEVTPILDSTNNISLAQPVIVKFGDFVYESVITEITDEYSSRGQRRSFVVGNKKIKAINVINKAIANTKNNTINNKILNSSMFSALEIGGRNYLSNSAFLSGSTGWTLSGGGAYSSIDTGRTLNGHPSLKVVLTGQTSNIHAGANTQNLPYSKSLSVKSGETWTISGWYYLEDASSVDNGLGLAFRGIGADNVMTNIGLLDIRPTTSNNGKWNKISLTVTANADYKECLFQVWVRKNGTAWFTDLKAERGNKATDWTPAPEDTASYEQRIAALEAAILSLGGET